MNKQFILRAFPDSRQDRVLGTTLLVIAGFVALLGVWAVFASVPEIAKTHGEVLPQGGDIHVIQSLSGGKILRVLVQEGDVVEKGQVIANIDQSVSEGDIRQLEVKHSNIMMRMERLRALEQARDPDFGAEEKQFPGMAKEQMQLFISEAELQASALRVIDDQIRSKEQELESASNQLIYLEEQLNNVKKEVAIFQDAADKGLRSKTDLLQKREQLSNLNKENEALLGLQSSAKASINTLKEQSHSKKLEMSTDYRTRRSEHVEHLREVEEQLIQAHNSLGQNALIATEAGIIKSLPNAKVGSVIQPGGVVAELVPSNQPLNVEVRVSPRDIGFIAIGQSVLIKVDAYDYSRFGAIPGNVSRISPATFKDERTNQPYFKAVIEPESEFVGNVELARRIKVGMTVEADITTGHKTIFQYLLKPVYTNIDTAMTER
jgi:HlyD family secretion protein/adhesin transport system membrane fusion protein